ncbi:hypothetical protein B0G84_8248 [Paraburkholderia sp. BL8N3]|nr:hypothetical protein [Paraburkholderia sp. BL8N3]TCK32452.1 hypothetical protein B0G84_8248 [Paraburkholderia sp. BL8N3]
MKLLISGLPHNVTIDEVHAIASKLASEERDDEQDNESCSGTCIWQSAAD